MRIAYVGDFENGIGDWDLAKRLWYAYHKLHKKDKEKTIEAGMLGTYCVLLQRDAPDEWVEQPPWWAGSADEFWADNSDQWEHTVSLSSGQFEVLIAGFQDAFNHYSTKTILALIRDWRSRVRARKNPPGT